MALKKVKGHLERVLDKNLQDLVRGIRNHKENEAKYISQCLDEIKQELRQDNIAIKANAVNKLAYLQMIGYDISWAAFNVIEVMSSTKFTFKRVGYLAASQSFNEGTDVLMLTTNMIRKDLSSQQMYDAGVALSGLSCFMTPDLARDLANDIMTLLTATRPYIRKKAVLITYKVFLKFPEALRPAFPRLKEKLEDPDPGVQSAAVNVVCELARKNPKNYLSLAPVFFKLMTSSTNNWMLIKIIKLFGALTPLEPRLGKKLIEPLTNLIHSTSAMSLLYECINTVIAVLISISSGVPNHSASIQLCVQKLRILIEDSDQNLKYLGLLAMSKILKTHPKSVQSHKDLILQCLDDKDESIRLRALDLLYGMVSKKNLMEIVKKLMIHMDKAEGSNYRDELLAKIIEICSQSNYQYVTNFEWYVSVLVELTRIEGTKHGKMIASQMLDVAIRVQAIRPFSVSQMAILLDNSHLLAVNSQRNGICEVLYAAAWICGEFSEHLKDPRSTLEAMLKSKATLLPGHIQGVFVQNSLKLYSILLTKAEEEDNTELVKELTQFMSEKLPMFVQSADLEVQERGSSALQLMKYVLKLVEKDVKVAEEVSALFAGELNPVAPKAQKKVPVPEGLDLDKWINDPPSESSEEEESSSALFSSTTDTHRSLYQPEKKVHEPTVEELAQMREQRRAEQESNPNYLKASASSKKTGNEYASNANDIPVAEIDLSVPLHIPGMSATDKYMQLQREQERAMSSKKGKKKKKHKKGKKGKVESEEEDDNIPVMHAVSAAYDMPEGASASEGEDDGGNPDDPHRLLDINLDVPLQPGETLPVRTHHVVGTNEQPEKEEKPKKKHKKDREGKKEKKSKKEKKKSKSKAKEEAEEPNLLGGTEESAAVAEPVQSATETVDVDTAVKENKMEDLDFWLSGSDAKPAAEAKPEDPEKPVAKSAADVVLTSEDEQPEEKHKKKKEKKHKKDKKSKSKKKRSEYLETDGISTPSKEQNELVENGPVNPNLPTMSKYQVLAENSHVSLTYETRASSQQGHNIIASIIFTNHTSSQIKDLEFNVMDSLNTKLVRAHGASQHDAVKVPFVLLPNAQNEGQFAFTVEQINMPQRLRGTLTYIVKNDDGATHDKLDFKLHLPCSSYLVPVSCKGDAFAEMLGSGNLNEKSSVTFNTSDSEFSIILAKICFYTHFSIVEQVDNTASLFSKSIQGHDICLLVKQLANKGISIDGKSTDSTLLSNVTEEIKTVLTKEEKS
ncbi:AP-3 complex subunit delta-1-like isoform X2 [Lingula anatina]|uniref:AP-3 complex subunit delta-1-like isoform X2 n=1 Tax=Lingula anatina TaxID=7574 RepID=A0A1S3HWT1_LINAN|nr:AP-3 complex subunit delta-1-like isoform X2 [Lingula anatina]|eukprot:XP_013390011.1 AP-3 complex subunit delta-1-like isoform X2 [Lingula anatina]